MQYLKLAVFFAVLYTALSSVPGTKRQSVSTSNGRTPLRQTSPITSPKPKIKPASKGNPKSNGKILEPLTTTQSTTSIPPGSCEYGGAIYQNYEYIRKQPCYYLQCLGGDLATGDIFCDTHDRCNLNRPPNDCCPACEVSTTQSTTSIPPGSCEFGGVVYQNNEYIEKHPCYYTICLDGAVAAGDIFCDTHDGCNLNRPPNDCCPACETTPEPELEQEPITPSPPGCYENGQWYQPGEVISSGNCGSSQCTENGIIYGDIFCEDSQYQCNWIQPPNSCCSVCQTTPEPEPITPSQTGCYENGQWYQNNEYIEKHPCYYTICLDGAMAAGDIFCETPDGCNLDWPPNDCCPACEATPEPQRPTTTSPPGCYEDNRWYKPGEVIYSDNCASSECTENGVIYGDIFCEDARNQCNWIKPPNSCCSACQTTPEPELETTTSSLPGCYENGKWYQFGETIYEEPCYSGICGGEVIVTNDIFCQDTRLQCNWNIPPNSCCSVCPTTTEATTEAN